MKFRAQKTGFKKKKTLVRTVEQTLASVPQIKKGIVELSQPVPLQRSQEGVKEQIVGFPVLPVKEEIADVSVLQFQQETFEVTTTIPVSTEADVQFAPQEHSHRHNSGSKDWAQPVLSTTRLYTRVNTFHEFGEATDI